MNSTNLLFFIIIINILSKFPNVNGCMIFTSNNKNLDEVITTMCYSQCREQCYKIMKLGSHPQCINYSGPHPVGGGKFLHTCTCYCSN